jgi:hypothetical protein
MGLSAGIYRNNKYGDSTNGGISKGVDRVTIVNLAGPFDPSDESPAVKFKEHMGEIIAVPADPAIGKGLIGPMFGGNFLYSHDSRFSEYLKRFGLTGAPVRIHDRFETSSNYNALSR